jgi:hypothetical protein
VGIGMALVIAVSFLLVIPIEPVYWLLAPLSGLLIGYYADARADRRSGPWRRILGNGLYAGLVTGLALAILLLGVKALFFVADNARDRAWVVRAVGRRDRVSAPGSRGPRRSRCPRSAPSARSTAGTLVPAPLGGLLGRR